MKNKKFWKILRHVGKEKLELAVCEESVTKPKSRKVLRQGHTFPTPNFSDCPSRLASRKEENKDKDKDKDK